MILLAGGNTVASIWWLYAIASYQVVRKRGSASSETIVRRTRYPGSRKARSAWRRLLAATAARRKRERMLFETIDGMYYENRR